MVMPTLSLFGGREPITTRPIKGRTSRPINDIRENSVDMNIKILLRAKCQILSYFLYVWKLT
mgnify:FL=1